MKIGGLLALLVTAGLLGIALRLASRGSQALGGMFRAPADGWPHGVQEDDDLHWRWRDTGPDREAGDDGPEAAADVERVRATAPERRQPPRSAARARS